MSSGVFVANKIMIINNEFFSQTYACMYVGTENKIRILLRNMLKLQTRE